jgi:hypothetical protein
MDLGLPFWVFHLISTIFERLTKNVSVSWNGWTLSSPQEDGTDVDRTSRRGIGDTERPQNNAVCIGWSDRWMHSVNAEPGGALGQRRR